MDFAALTYALPRVCYVNITWWDGKRWCFDNEAIAVVQPNIPYLMNLAASKKTRLWIRTY